MRIKTKKLDKIYLISDLHLLHKNIIKYCNRPFIKQVYNEETKINEALPDVYGMGIHFLREFDKLEKGSILLNLGDLGMMCWNDLDYISKYVYYMKRNKKLWLILGNHDFLRRAKADRKKYSGKEEKFYKKLGFNRVSKDPIYIPELNVIFSHEPYYSDNYNIHGHTHDKNVGELLSDPENVDVSKFFNVSCDVIDYKPIKLTDVLNKLGIEIKTKYIHIKRLKRKVED